MRPPPTSPSARQTTARSARASSANSATCSTHPPSTGESSSDGCLLPTMGFKGFGKFGFGGFRKPRISDLRGIFVDHLGRLHAGRGNVLITELGILFPVTDYQTYVQWRDGSNNDESYIYANSLILGFFTCGQLYFY